MIATHHAALGHEAASFEGFGIAINTRERTLEPWNQEPRNLETLKP
jgi:hypothetical protein